MKRIIINVLFLILFLFTANTVVEAESKSNLVWKEWTTQTDVDIDKAWTINFNDEIESWGLWNNIYIIRESDQKKVSVDPIVVWNLKKSAKILLHELYDFDETYTLYIKDGIKTVKGKALKEPVKMKFKTTKPNVLYEETVEKDGVEFQLKVSSNTSREKLHAEIKVKNISKEPIQYNGFNGCDPGVKTLLSKENKGKYVNLNKSDWNLYRICTMDVPSYTLEPGGMIEITDVYLPSGEITGDYLLKITFQRHLSDYSFTPIQIDLPISF